MMKRTSREGPSDAGACPAEEEYLRLQDGELDEPSRLRLEEHLSSCARCREIADSLDLLPHLGLHAHPEPSVLASYHEGRLSPLARAAAEEHLAKCALCRDTMESLRADSLSETPPIPARILQEAASGCGAAPRFPRRTRGSRASGRRLLRAGIVAAAAASLVLMIGYARHALKGDPVRDRQETVLPTDLALEPVGVVVSAEEETLLFRWRAVPDAALYRLRVLDALGSAVAKVETAGPDLSLPWRDVLQRGSRYFWEVEIVFPDGTRYRSEMQEFTIAEDRSVSASLERRRGARVPNEENARD
jgi:anti-sigma factor RsiW